MELKELELAREREREHSQSGSGSANHKSGGGELSCRFCFEGEKAADELILPCACKQMRSHRSCLDKWRGTKKSAFNRCEVCLYEYVLEQVQPPPMWARHRTQYVLKVTLLVFRSFLILAGGIAFWAGVCYLLDGSHKLSKEFGVSPTASYVLWGILLFFFTVDLYGLYWLVTSEPDRGGGGGCHCGFIPDCGGGEGAIIGIVCVIIIGVVFGLYFFAVSVHNAGKEHLRIQENYRVVDRTRVVSLQDL